MPGDVGASPGRLVSAVDLPTFEIANPVLNGFAPEARISAELDVRDAAGASLRVDPIPAHAEHRRDVVGI